MQLNSSSAASTSFTDLRSDFKDDLLEQYKRNYSTNRIWMWLSIVFVILLVTCYLLVYNKTRNNAYKPIPSGWNLESKMANDNYGKLVALSVISGQKNTNDGFIRRILVSHDSAASFIAKGGPWDSCSALIYFSVAPDSNSIIAADRNSIFIKTAAVDSFLRIPFTAFTASKAYLDPGTDTIYFYRERDQRLLAFNYKSVDKIVEYELSKNNVFALAIVNKPKRKIQVVTQNYQTKRQIIDSAVTLRYLRTYGIFDLTNDNNPQAEMDVETTLFDTLAEAK